MTTKRKTSKELVPVARLSVSAADVLFGSPAPDTFYEDMAAMRKLSDLIVNGLPRLTPHEGMAQASAGWALVSVEPTEGYPDFTMPPIPGLYGVPYASKEA